MKASVMTSWRPFHFNSGSSAAITWRDSTCDTLLHVSIEGRPGESLRLERCCRILSV